MDGCLKIYHLKCVGLPHIISQKEGDMYTNCSDSKSYICPNCANDYLGDNEQDN